ncbi:MAG TPA: multidrug/spermidine efflux SMR transporter subunit MdtI [Dyella sp.]|uniref:multidrug/spermidine efflux SMR transporter subunit MdtI n=1 Tax=Dyella sp. TaxID=1869338 RepID=UPI002D79B6AC|nr:multidrug/spermidine efflux SMR transporter subunit MdtI [Dyella sp.]HET6555261.1 multidrug/spermidine efflux SMR transporter subunit MdtI [Dyella sp.]
MLPEFEPIHLLYLAIAIVLEIAANVLMKQSHGFAHKRPALSAIVCALLAFTALSYAIKGIQLSVAYGIWGGVGLIATTLLGMTLFGEHLRASGWAGLALITAGVCLLKFA